MDLNVFISWSGTRSRKLAEAVYEFLPDVIQQARPWLSSEDIDRGRRWGLELAGALKEAKIGILCLTPENIESRWVLFEAGALAKTLDTAYVCPYLLGLEKSQVPPPLGDFQMSSTNRDETLSLVKALNNALGRPIEDLRRLERIFDRCWPELEAKINELMKEKPSERKKPEPRDPADMLGEILDRLRDLERVRPPHNTPAANPGPVYWSGIMGSVARHLVNGRSIEEIAKRYGLSPADVERQLLSLADRFGTPDTQEAARRLIAVQDKLEQ